MQSSSNMSFLQDIDLKDKSILILCKELQH